MSITRNSKLHCIARFYINFTLIKSHVIGSVNDTTLYLIRHVDKWIDQIRLALSLFENKYTEYCGRHKLGKDPHASSKQIPSYNVLSAVADHSKVNAEAT